jgi:cell division septum initiation protein DivIVA
MTDKEFKRLSRAQLIDVIYQFQLQVDKLTEQNKKLERELADKRIRLSEAGNIADAALIINDCFRSTQNAAEQYLSEIKMIRDEAETEKERIIAQAKMKAAAIIADAKEARQDFDSSKETILIEHKRSHSDNG